MSEELSAADIALFGAINVLTDGMEPTPEQLAEFRDSLFESGWTLARVEPTEKMARAYRKASAEYDKWKAERIFPRPTLADHLWDAMLVAQEE